MQMKEGGRQLPKQCLSTCFFLRVVSQFEQTKVTIAIINFLLFQYL